MKGKKKMNKVYTNGNISIDRNIWNAFKAKCVGSGITLTDKISELITNYTYPKDERNNLKQMIIFNDEKENKK